MANRLFEMTEAIPASRFWRMKNYCRILLLGTIGLVTPACAQEAAPAPKPETVKTEAVKPEEGWTVSDWSEWKQQDTGPEAKVKVVAELAETKPKEGRAPLVLGEEAKKAGVLLLGRGEPFAIVKYIGKQPLLVDQYEISWQAMRVDGNDFFASLTFPVGSAQKCATFVTGGWGGWTTGVSSLQHQFANENETTGSMEFQSGRWYEFTLQVNTQCLRALIDGKEQFKVGLKGKSIDMHPSEITKSMPLGFSSYSTRGAIRNVKIRPLKAGELVAPAEPE